jgi:PIN domain nuclease of toxin-antitoxin system
MSDVLLDSHVLLWLLDDSPRLGADARQRVGAANAVYVSAASTWELAIKAALGKLSLPDGFEEAVGAAGLRELPVRHRHTLASTLTDLPHRDPFDTILVTQARLEGLLLLTADTKILDACDGTVDARR